LRTGVRLGAVVAAGACLWAVAVFDEGWMARDREYSKGAVVRYTVAFPAKAGEWRETYVQIAAGTFLMGCSPGDGECFDYEKPAHEVRISKAFYLAETEVTEGNFAKYAAEAGLTRERESDPSLPAVRVNWEQAKGYCEWSGGRLPTEAEWEYAARGGTTGARYGALDDIAWHSRNSGLSRHLVRTKLPNAYGLYDMLGNVWEWTADWYGAYDAGAVVDPRGPEKGSFRVTRGGGWNFGPVDLRASYRNDFYPGMRTTMSGFGVRGKDFSTFFFVLFPFSSFRCPEWRGEGKRAGSGAEPLGKFLAGLVLFVFWRAGKNKGKIVENLLPQAPGIAVAGVADPALDALVDVVPVQSPVPIVMPELGEAGAEAFDVRFH